LATTWLIVVACSHLFKKIFGNFPPGACIQSKLLAVEKNNTENITLIVSVLHLSGNIDARNINIYLKTNSDILLLALLSQSTSLNIVILNGEIFNQVFK